MLKLEINNKVNLKKLSLIELKEVLNRQILLRNNRSLLTKLPDKGDSIKKHIQDIEKEISHREDILQLEKSIQKINISDNQSGIVDKHVLKVYDYDKCVSQERYKPFSTLKQTCKEEEHKSILLPLKQSINMLKTVDEKYKEIEIKKQSEKLQFVLDEESSDDEDTQNINLNLSHGNHSDDSS